MSTVSEDEREGAGMCAVKLSTKQKVILGGVIVIALVGLGVGLGDTLFKSLVHSRSWFLNHEPWTLMVYWLIFTGSVGDTVKLHPTRAQVAVLLPFSPFCISVGFIYGVGFGLFVQEVANLISASALFILGQRTFGHWVRRKLEFNPHLRRVELAMDNWRTAARLNLLLCFCPIPYALHVHLFAVGGMSFPVFVGSFVLGMIPNTLLFCMSGRALYHVVTYKSSGKSNASVYETVSLSIGLGAGVILLCYIAYLVRKELRAMEEPEDEDPLLETEDIPDPLLDEDEDEIEPRGYI